jgi:hypothetical protein
MHTPSLIRLYDSRRELSKNAQRDFAVYDTSRSNENAPPEPESNNDDDFDLQLQRIHFASERSTDQR